MPDNINWAALFTQFPGLQQAVAQIQPQQAQQPGMVSDWGTGGQVPAWRGLAHWGQRAAGYLAGRPASPDVQGFTPQPLPGYGGQPQFSRPQPRTIPTQFPRPQIDPSIVGNIPRPMQMGQAGVNQQRQIGQQGGMANAQSMGVEAMPGGMSGNYGLQSGAPRPNEPYVRGATSYDMQAGIPTANAVPVASSEYYGMQSGVPTPNGIPMVGQGVDQAQYLQQQLDELRRSRAMQIADYGPQAAYLQAMQSARGY